MTLSKPDALPFTVKQISKVLIKMISLYDNEVLYYFYLSYNVAAIQWTTLCHKNQMTTRVITLWRVHLTSLTTSMSTICFLIEIMFILKKINSNSKGSYDKQNFTLVVISYEIYETRQRLVS